MSQAYVLTPDAQRLALEINQLCDLIDSLDILGDHRRLKQTFVRQAGEVVDNWILKFPNNPRDTTPLHHMTYGAIIEHGGIFRSPKTGQTYDWLEKL